MKFALVNGQRHEAQPKLSAICPGCDQPMIAKCGEVRMPHWAHRRTLLCDPWWENETEWHRNWKDQFPEAWQEYVYRAEDGEKHIADVRTDKGWVIEFQHSSIKPDERRSRDAFYKKLVWVVDGTRLKRDQKQFIETVNSGTSIAARLPIQRVRPDECALLQKWIGSHTPIFFDFGGEQPLAWLIAGRPYGPAYVGPVSRASFIAMHGGGVTQSVRDFDELVKDFNGLVADYEAYLKAQALRRASPQPLPGYQRYLARRKGPRRF
jgi:hypothetical protein